MLLQLLIEDSVYFTNHSCVKLVPGENYEYADCRGYETCRECLLNPFHYFAIMFTYFNRKLETRGCAPDKLIGFRISKFHVFSVVNLIFAIFTVISIF